jgi:hypothetical protein
MSLINLIKAILNIQKRLDIKTLPSQGLFYKNDFEVWIKKADVADIIEYEHNYTRDNIGTILNKIKVIVEKNTILSPGYSFNDIRSIDIIFIFFEIVRFTKGKSIRIRYFNDEIGKEDIIEFDSQNFNYFLIDEKIMKFYNKENRSFEIDGYKYTVPTIGVEDCLSNFLISKSYEPDAIKYNSFSYDFIYFLSHKNKLSFNDIDNLIHIFNYDMEDVEKKKVRNIIKIFSPIQKYSLKTNGKIIDISSKIDLEKIWK